MNIDIGEVLTRAWQISWKHKVLWVYGFVLTLAGFLILPLAFVPIFAPVMSSRFEGRNMDESIFLLIFFAGFFLFLVVMYPISVLLNSALTIGVLRGERSEEKLSFMDLIRESYPFFWRILGTMLLFVGGMMIVYFAFAIVMTLVSVVTFGLGMMCMIPLSFLQYPLMLVWYVCMEQSMTAVIADNMGVMDAIKQSWQLFRKNIWAFVLVGLVLYFGVSIISSVVMMPIMLPFFFIPFAMESAEFNKTILLFAGLCAMVFIPIFAIFQGGVMALMKSGWVITYLRLTRSSNEPQPALQEVAA